MRAEFDRVRVAQLRYNPVRTLPARREPTEDWSSQTLRLLSAGSFAQAEAVAQTEFESSREPHAFLLWVSAAARDGRYFDCLRTIDAHPEMLEASSPVSRDVRRLALTCALETRQLQRASRLVEECLAQEEPSAGLLLKKASILGLQARYQDACALLLRLNREYPGRLAVLKRLVLVYEQLRDTGKAVAFLRAYLRAAPDDSWARGKQEEFAALGLT
jgi:serine/threonine-protein kinase